MNKALANRVVSAVAGNMLRRWASRHPAPGLTSVDFADEACEDVAAVLRGLAEADPADRDVSSLLDLAQSLERYAPLSAEQIKAAQASERRRIDQRLDHAGYSSLDDLLAEFD